MQENELNHAGIKGMHWGEQNYQTSDGTWTPAGLARRRAREGDGSGGKKEGYFARKKRIRAEKEKAAKAAKYKKAAEVKAAKEKKAADEKAKQEAIAKETLEQKRERVLKSTNAQELYNNRDILTTAEIRERMDRINVEAQLNKIATSTKKTGMDRVNTAIEWGKKANECYEMLQKPMYKAIAKKLGFNVKDTVKITNYKKSLENINKLSDQEVKDLANRIKNETALRNAVNGLSNNTNQNNNNNNRNNQISEEDIREMIEEALRNQS